MFLPRGSAWNSNWAYPNLHPFTQTCFLVFVSFMGEWHRAHTSLSGLSIGLPFPLSPCPHNPAVTHSVDAPLPFPFCIFLLPLPMGQVLNPRSVDSSAVDLPVFGLSSSGLHIPLPPVCQSTNKGLPSLHLACRVKLQL